MSEISEKHLESLIITDDCDAEPIEWLTKDYLEKALRMHYKKEFLEVIKIDAKPATAKGENYASIMTRLKVEYSLNNNERKTYMGHYILKTSFEGDEFATEKLHDYDIFNRELEIYDKIIPKLNDLLKEINDEDQLFADAIHVDYEHSAILFDDLSVKSFQLCDRITGLNMNHAKISLEKLAKLHATSAVLNERNGGLLEKFDRGMFNRHTEAFSPLFVDTLEACGKTVSEWDSNDFQLYGEKLLKLKPYVMEYGKRVFDPIKNGFNSFVHGDFWTNNIMFRYDSDCNSTRDDPKDNRIIDFQYSCWASPAVDLHYFFNTSLREEIRLHQLDELVQFYYNILSDTLRALNYKAKIPTLYEFWLQYSEKSFYAFTSACLIQPIQINTDTKDADLHALLENNERALNFKRRLYKNEAVQKNLQRLLSVFDKRGLLDIQD